MAKTIDINERTLEKEKKSFGRFCRVGKVLSVFLLITMILGLVTQGYDLMVSVVTANMWYTLICASSNIIAFAGLAVAWHFSISIFGMLIKDDTPFKYALADKIKGAAIALTVSGGICTAIEIVVVVICSMNVYGYNSFEGMIGGLDSLIIGLVLMALSYIFNYGCRLQQESDETL